MRGPWGTMAPAVLEEPGGRLRGCSRLSKGEKGTGGGLGEVSVQWVHEQQQLLLLLNWLVAEVQKHWELSSAGAGVLHTRHCLAPGPQRDTERGGSVEGRVGELTHCVLLGSGLRHSLQ